MLGHCQRGAWTVTNLLVSLMPDEVRSELSVAGSEFFLRQGDAVASEFLEGSYVFVVEDGVASKFMRSNLGIHSEVAMVGREGMFPACGLLAVPSSAHVVIAQVGEVRGRRIRSREFHSIVGDSKPAKLLIRKYIYAFITQIASNIQTSEQDSVVKRIARWLLMCHDRIHGIEINLTHDTLAQMVFAQRPTVTNALNAMRDQGLIELGRGRVKIVDRLGLDRLADGSYGLSETYWNEHIGPFGKSPESLDRDAA